jgi:hypothetical protein
LAGREFPYRAFISCIRRIPFLRKEINSSLIRKGEFDKRATTYICKIFSNVLKGSICSMFLDQVSIAPFGESLKMRS